MNELIIYGFIALIIIVAVLLCLALALPQSRRTRLFVAIPTCLALGYSVCALLSSIGVQQANNDSSGRAIHELAEYLRDGKTNVVVNTILTSDEIFSKSGYNGLSFEKIMWMSDTGDASEKTQRSDSGSSKTTAPDTLVYTCVIPDGYERNVILYNKDGTSRKADAHQIYKRCHSEGWHGMMQHYLKTGKTDYSPFPQQEWARMYVAREIGISEAKAVLLQLKLTIGEEKLKSILTTQYAEETPK